MTDWFRAIWARLLAAFRAGRLEREFDEELTTHLELLTDEGMRRGLTRDDARREAIRKLGRPASLRDVHRETRGIPVLELLAQDLRYAVRRLAKSPGFACVAILTLALGIGANTALFSLVDALLVRSLAVRDPDRLVQVQRGLAVFGFTKPGLSLSEAAFDYIRRHNQVLSEIAGFNELDRPVVVIDGVTEQSRQAEQVSENFFRDLGVRMALGRAPESADGPVAVIGFRLWRSRFDGNPNVLGRPVTIDGQVYLIIGVAAPRFVGVSLESSVDFWISPTGASAHGPQQMIARLKPGAETSNAQAALEVLFKQFYEAGIEPGPPPNVPMRTALVPAGRGLSILRAQYERPLTALMALVTLVLLITCANVANLSVVRNTARSRELTLRVALGARRSRLIVQCLAESAVLAGFGGIFALVFARWGVSALLSMLPLRAIPEGLTFQADARVLGFAAGVSLLCALLFGFAPAWRATQVDVTATLKSSQRSTAPKGARRLGRVLVACQVGISVLLLAGAGLFVQSLKNLMQVDVGYETSSLLQVSIDTRGAGYRQGKVGGVYRLLLDRVRAIPGVVSVSAIRNRVMEGATSIHRMPIPGRTLGPREFWESAEVGPNFFETMGIPVLRGQGFVDADFAQNRAALVINESFAKRYFPDEDPVGKRIGGPPGVEIIGVVKDSRLDRVRRENGPMVYFKAPGEPDRVDALVVRATGDPAAVARAIQQEVRRVNPRLLIGLRTMREEIGRSLARERMVAATSAFFSLLGLALASIGIFGVASYSVAQRTNELGIRMALGAGRWSVIREALGETMMVFGVGLAGGIVAAIVAVRLSASAISDLLYGLTATDPANLAVAALLMAGVALAACILPAWHATRIDPLSAIRYE